MAEQKTRLYSLPEVTQVTNDMYLMLDASATGARKYNLKTLYDKVDSVQASADAATTAATAATAAADSANTAATTATEAATSAGETVAGLVEDVDEALDAIGDISEQAVPLMSATTRGGAKLGTGLEISDGMLSVNTTSSGDGSAAGPILSLSANGWAEQDTTSGKNLQPPKSSTSTASGITFTVNADGSITCTGTASSRAIVLIPTAGLQTNTAYTLSGCPANGSNSSYRADLRNGSDMVSSVADYGGGVTFTLSTAYTDLNYAIRIESGYVCPSGGIVFKPQIELGSTATAYEPYTGGAPSPSPDYPQEIQVAKGRNLLNRFAVTTGKYISNAGVATNSAEMFYSEQIPVVSGDTYTISGISGVKVRVFVSGYNSNGTWTQSIVYTNTIAIGDMYSETFTVPSDVSYVVVSRAIADTDIQLERGSVATPYVPYGYVGMEVQGKNLWHQTIVADGDSVTSNGVTMTACDNGSGFLASGTATANAYYPSAMSSADARLYSLLSAGTYTASSNTAFRIRKLVNGTVEDIKGATTGSWTFVLDEDTLVRIIPIVLSGAVLSTPTYMWVQIEKGSTATPYQPYHNSTTPIPLPLRGWVASLPDGTADTLTLDGAGKVTWEKACNEVVLDGSASAGITVTGGQENLVDMYFQKDLTGKDASKQTAFVSSLSPVTLVYGAGTSNAGKIGFHLPANQIRIRFRPYELNAGGSTTATEALSYLNTWLSTHPITVLYPLATPVTEERGYVEMPEISVGAEISIPELDDLGVRYCVDMSALEMARMWYEKARSEYAEELLELRITVNELATRIQ